MIRRFAFLFPLLMILFLGLVRTTGQASVSPDTLQSTPYVIDTPDLTLVPTPYGAPIDTEIPYEGPSTPSATLSTQASATQSTPLPPTSSPPPGSTLLVTTTPASTASATEGPSPTAGRDLFGTEDAEISNSRVTPPPSDTPAPSRTATPSVTPTATPAPPAGFLFNPIWFFGGLAFAMGAFFVGWLVIRAKGSGEFG